MEILQVRSKCPLSYLFSSMSFIAPQLHPTERQLLLPYWCLSFLIFYYAFLSLSLSLSATSYIYIIYQYLPLSSIYLIYIIDLYLYLHLSMYIFSPYRKYSVYPMAFFLLGIFLITIQVIRCRITLLFLAPSEFPFMFTSYF